MSRKSLALAVAFGLLAADVAHPQSSAQEIFQRGVVSYRNGRLAEAENSFRYVTAKSPDDIAAYMYLGQTLFREEKYAAATAVYERVQVLEKSGAKLTLMQHRILVDQLAMAYGISGRTADSKALLQEGVRNDPNYPVNYYNLACVAADENDKSAVLKNLSLALWHRAQVLPGEQMPDPASDPSFQKFGQDADFKALVSRFKH